LTGDTSVQKYWYWSGKSGAGKSQIQTIMRGIMGPLAGDLDASSLVSSAQRSAGVDSDLADCRDTRLIFCSEISAEYLIDDRIVKAITGGDPLKVKKMNHDKFPLKADAKLIMTSNSGEVRFKSPIGMPRRVVMIKFEKSFHESTERVEDIGEKLLEAEGPQILGYLAKRASKVLHQKKLILTEPQKIRNWSANYIAMLQYQNTHQVSAS
jgi:putative DNA primase/helicase